ncbi:MAG: alpha/beta fold hydrolase [Selenomonadaceae bacterium]|nr:alpha/beta fold hydrolase [Selenomonadaceae bacterium]MBR3723592.1 alpha/beta fold hydrolase [Selenomonadaceae bacterium]
MVIKGAEPFLKLGGDTGILLIHGFTGTPADLLLLGEYLNSKNYTVLAPRLTGHGSSAKTLENTTAENWMDAAYDGYAILKGAAKRIYVVGHSMGGILALILAAEKEVAGVVTLAAPITVAKERGISLLPPREVAKGMFLPKEKKKLVGVPAVVNRKQAMPLLSVHEMLDVIETAKKSMKKVTAPALIVHSENDRTADPESAEFIMANIKSVRKRLKLVSGFGHLLPLEDGKEAIFKEIEDFIDEEEKRW